MNAEVERRLERLFMRLEFGEGAAIHVIAPQTWLAECEVREVLLARLCAGEGWEVLDLRLGPDDDILDPGRALAATLSTATSSVLVHVHDDGVAVDRWQPLFRRLNEVRNAVLREFPKKLVVLLAARLVIEFAGEAPDVWSIGAPLVVGERDPEVLNDAMLADVPALIGLTRFARDVGAIEGSECHDLARWSANLRARQLFELELSRHRLASFHHVRRRGGELHLSIVRRRENVMLRVGGGGRRIITDVTPEHVIHFTWYEWEGQTCCVVNALSLGERMDVIEALQTSAEADLVIWIGLYERCSASIRAGVNLVVAMSPGRGWLVEAGGEGHAPVLQIPSGVEVRVDRGWAQWESARGFRSGRGGDDGRQLWLPGIEPDFYGEAPLYADAK